MFDIYMEGRRVLSKKIIFKCYTLHKFGGFIVFFFFTTFNADQQYIWMDQLAES